MNPINPLEVGNNLTLTVKLEVTNAVIARKIKSEIQFKKWVAPLKFGWLSTTTASRHRAARRFKLRAGLTVGVGNLICQYPELNLFWS